MRVVLLAAGRAQRLRPLTDHLPKCLLEVGGRSIVARAVATLAEHGLRDVTVVDGFEGDRLRAALSAEFPASWLHFVRNDDWATTNNAWSLLLARRAEAEPMMLLDADIVFDAAVVAAMLAGRGPSRLALRTQGGVGDEEMKVVLDEAGRVADIGKTLPADRAVGESVGIEIFSAEAARRLFATLERRMKTTDGPNEWYESSFVDMIRAGEEIWPVDLGDLACMEIDTVDDLERARRHFGT